MSKALITGASSGIGKEFAYILAEKGFDLFIVARSKDKLDKIASSLKETFNISVNVIVKDLSEEKSSFELFELLKGEDIDIVINNAGFGKYGDFLNFDADTYRKMINLNILTLTILTRLFGEKMAKRKHGKILNVSSTAAFQPLPRFSVYAATKAYVLSLSEALHYEFAKYGVTVTVLCPGPTKTNFGETAETHGTKMFNPAGLANPRFVAEEGLKGLFNGKPLVITGKQNKILAFLAKALPFSAILKISSYFVK